MTNRTPDDMHTHSHSFRGDDHDDIPDTQNLNADRISSSISSSSDRMTSDESRASIDNLTNDALKFINEQETKQQQFLSSDGDRNRIQSDYDIRRTELLNESKYAKSS